MLIPEPCGEVRDGDAVGGAEVNEFEEIESSLTGLQFADVRLRPVNGLGQLGLRQPCLGADLLQEVAENLMAR